MASIITYSLGINDINDGAELSAVRTEIDKTNTSNLNETSETL